MAPFSVVVARPCLSTAVPCSPPSGHERGGEEALPAVRQAPDQEERSPQQDAGSWSLSRCILTPRLSVASVHRRPPCPAFPAHLARLSRLATDRMSLSFTTSRNASTLTRETMPSPRRASHRRRTSRSARPFPSRTGQPVSPCLIAPSPSLVSSSSFQPCSGLVMGMFEALELTERWSSRLLPSSIPHASPPPLNVQGNGVGFSTSPVKESLMSMAGASRCAFLPFRRHLD